MKHPWFLSLFVLLTTLIAVPASAGGSWLEPNDIRVEAGDHLVLGGWVSVGQLGWIEDGPYLAYLTGEEYGLPVEDLSGTPQTDVVLLGSVDISDATDVGAFVSIEFNLPESVPAGKYLVAVCNDPCTVGFGDLIGAQLFIGMDPVFEDVAALADDSITTGPSRALSPDPITTDEPALVQAIASPEMPTSDDGFDRVLVGGGAIVGLVLVGGLLRLVRRPHHEASNPEKIPVSR
jgi:hypothetical protein